MMADDKFLIRRTINKRVAFGHIEKSGVSISAFRKTYSEDEFTRVMKVVRDMHLNVDSCGGGDDDKKDGEDEEDCCFPKVLFVNAPKRILVWEACGNDLRERALDMGSGIRLSTTQYLLKKVLQSIAALHTKDIIHCDVKTENIFHYGKRVVLGDFDLCNTPLRGTPMNVPPETDLLPARDVWAFGQLAFELLTGKTTWIGRRANSAQRQARRIWLGAPRLMPYSQVGFYWNAEDTSALIMAFAADNLRRESALIAVDFIRPCLAEDVSKRPSIAELQSHAFFL